MRIEKWVYGGDGLSRVDGRIVLTPFVLPGETAVVEPSPYRAGIFTGRVTEIREPSPHRVDPPCPYFGRCGGCQYQHAPYGYQVDRKVDILREVLRRVGKMEAPAEIATVTGEPWNYRNRIQLHLEHAGLGYRAQASHKLIPITQCPIASPRLNEAIAALLGMMEDRRFPRFLRSLELFTNETETQFHVLETERPLAKAFFEWCEERIPGAAARSLDYRAAGESFRVGRKSFFQVNRHLVDQLPAAALGGAAGESALDLYAGVGLFSLPLARRFPRVTAVESGMGAVEDLEFNASRAGLTVNAVRSSVDLYLETLASAPDFVLADPPRSGLGKAVVKELLRLRAPRLHIVSCDPSTLARDLAALCAGGYRLDRLALADLFPQTFHIESVAELAL